LLKEIQELYVDLDYALAEAMTTRPHKDRLGRFLDHSKKIDSWLNTLIRYVRILEHYRILNPGFGHECFRHVKLKDKRHLK